MTILYIGDIEENEEEQQDASDDSDCSGGTGIQSHACLKAKLAIHHSSRPAQVNIHSLSRTVMLHKIRLPLVK